MDISPRIEGNNEMSEIDPLTHPDPRRPGQAYKRLEQVQSQIEEVLSLQPLDLIKRASVLDYRERTFLQPECLVYFLRKQHRMGQEDLVNSISTILLKRCAKFIYEKIRGVLDERYISDCFSEAVGRVFMPILELSSDDGDYAQVRFWVFLRIPTKTA